MKSPVSLALLRRSDTQGSVAFAALSLAADEAPQSTIETIVADRALTHYWEGLRQFLTIRLSEGAVPLALERLESLEFQRGTEPSARAQLYREARAACAGRRPNLDREWWSRSLATRHGERLEKLRAELWPDEVAFDVAELAFARQLESAELRHVLDLSEEEVEAAFERIGACAREVLGADPDSRDRTLEGALLEAFALAPSRRRPRTEPLFAIGTVVAGRYRLVAHLGSGAFADVYQATDDDVPGHEVALKIFRARADDDATRDAALRELRLIASVTHPSVVQFKDHGWHTGRFYFVMPLYRGETLRERLARGPLDRVEARRIFEPLARALAALHRAGIRHQDVKPENVFLARPDELGGDEVLPVLLDLGVAAKDAENVLAGTPSYLAPEVAARFAREPDPPGITPKADVFALALTLRNALAPEEEEPVLAGAVDAFVHHRARRAPRAPRRRDLRYLKPYFERWLHLAPDERPSAEAMVSQLKALTRPEERRARRVSVLRWVLPLAAIFAAAVFVLHRETELQRLEATKARELASIERLRAAEASERAAQVREDLAASLERRRALEADVARLEEEYGASRLTRQELASKLAHAESQLAVVVADAERRAAEVDVELRRAHAERDQARVALGEQSQLAQQERTRADGLRAEVDALTAEIEEASASTADARARVDALEHAIAALRLSLPDVDPEPGAPESEPEPSTP